MSVCSKMRCFSLNACIIDVASYYTLAGSVVTECVSFVAFVARRANSLQTPCVCNAMQRNEKERTRLVDVPAPITLSPSPLHHSQVQGQVHCQPAGMTGVAWLIVGA